MRARRVLALPLALVVGLPVLSLQARAEDLAAKRELCRTEARQRIKAPRGGVDLLKISVESRQTYVRECMARAPGEPISTGALKNPSPRA